MIRYQEEEVELNDIGHFRIEMAQVEDVYMEIELMFSDLLPLGGPDKFQQSSTLREITDGKVEFKSVSLRKYHLRALEDGVFEYVPVVFEEQHFCVSLCTVHSSLINYSYRSSGGQNVAEYLFSNDAGEL